MAIAAKKETVPVPRREALAVIGLTYRLAETLVEGSENKKIVRLAERLKAQVEKSRRDVWPDALDEKQDRRLNYRCEALQWENPVHVSVLTSAMLAVLSDQYFKCKKNRERDALDPMLSILEQVHKNYDRRLDRFEAYDEAAGAIKQMYTRDL